MKHCILYMKGNVTAALNLAQEEANKSTHRAQHGCVLFKNGKIIQSGRNQYCGMERLRHYGDTRIWSIHAEMNAVSGIPKHITKGASLVIVKIKDNQLVKSRPCDICMSIIKGAGIKNIMYSEDTNRIISELI